MQDAREEHSFLIGRGSASLGSAPANKDSSLNGHRNDDAFEHINSHDAQDRASKRQRTSYDPSDAVFDPPSLLSAATKGKKRGLSIAHEFEREISVAQPSTSSQTTEPNSPTSQPPESETQSEDVGPTNLFSPKASTPEKEAPKQVPKVTARRETISPIRISTQSELQGRRDTLSPDGFKRLEMLVEETENNGEETKTSNGDADHVQSPVKTKATQKTTYPTEASKKQDSEQSIDRSPIYKSKANGDSKSKRTTLDPSDVVRMFGQEASSDTTLRRSTLDPSEALAMLNESQDVEITTTKASRRSTMNPQDIAQLGESKERRETLDPSDLKSMMNVDSSDEDEVLESFRRESRDSFSIGDVSIAESEQNSPTTEGNVNEESKDDSLQPGLEELSRRKSPRRISSRVISPAPEPLVSPPLRRKLTTPLKSCLSARKVHKSTTPTKTVVFGSPRGAEFRINDPSTSMTPMCDREAKQMFPLDKHDSDEDEVTSENTSILEEADHLLEENDSMSFPFGSIRSPNRSKRNSDAKGVSPLDSIKDARRKRRTSFGSKQETKPSRRQSLLGVNVMQNNDALIVGSAKKAPLGTRPSHSSSSSDDDMDITGEYANIAASRQKELTNGLGDLWNENYTPQKAVDVASESSEEDQTLDLGPIGTLKGDASLFSRAQPTEKEPPSAPKEPSQFMELKQLHPIQEEGETSHNSSISQLSVSSDDEDEDYNAQRETLVINLGSRFEKIGSSSKKKAQQTSPPQPEFSPPRAFNLSDELEAELEKTHRSPEKHHDNATRDTVEEEVEIEDVSIQAVVESLNILELDEVISSEVSKCSDLMALSPILPQKESWTQARDDLSEWLTELNRDAQDIQNKVAPKFIARMFHTEELQSAPLLRSLYESHVNSVLSEWYVWRTRSESPSTWSKSRAAIERDLNTLQSHHVGRHERHEQQVVQQLLKKEAEMERSLESIQEQQSIRAEYTSRIKSLESKIDGLKLQLMQHEQSMALLKKASESSHAAISVASMEKRVHLTQERDELVQISSRLSKWKYQIVGRGKFKVSMMCKSFSFSQGIHLTVGVDTQTTSQPQVDINATFAAQARPSPFSAIASLVWSTLFDLPRLRDLASTIVQSPQDVKTFLQRAELDLSRATRLWNDLEMLVLQYSVKTMGYHIIISFVSFKHLVKLDVGLPISPHFYHAHLVPTISVEFGHAMVNEVDLCRRIQRVQKGFHRLRAICSSVESYLADLA
ncbi:hypothetical protein AeMF1_002062 [Aphanomyces euteiches]|nr:hypothetical protein AeMF1_002062 [Aphanomyces euteiches]KAH9188332.1 hypothetical protein AeNC1_009693 [Aphanomyces euteiches]